MLDDEPNLLEDEGIEPLYDMVPRRYGRDRQAAFGGRTDRDDEYS
jgi:hypothetical protein